MNNQDAIKRLSFLKTLFNYAIRENSKDQALQANIEALDIAIEAINTIDRKEIKDNDNK